METFIEIARNFWDIFREMAPYLLFGFFVAGLISVFLNTEFVESHLGGRGWKPITKASLFGVPLPLCSCSVIPVATSLRRQGSSKAATTSFLLSTPQTGVDSILVTFSLLGPVFAIYRPLTAFLTGVVGGGIMNLTGDKSSPTESSYQPCECDNCDEETKTNVLSRVFRHGFITLPRDIGKPLLIGLLIAGAIGALVPDSFFADHLGTGFLPMLAMMLLGIPIYVCATASVPIAAVMIMKGVTPGAALVFLMTGPATNAATFAAIWTILGKRETFIYLGIVAISALTCGVVLDLLFDTVHIPEQVGTARMLPGWLKTISAIALVAVISFATFRPRHSQAGES